MRGYALLKLLLILAVVSSVLVLMKNELRTGIEYVRSEVMDQKKVGTRSNANRVKMWSDIRLKKVFSGFNRPLYLTHAPGRENKVYIVEKKGIIKVADQESGVVNQFMDITRRVGDRGSEQGLLSVAFHPSYSENGRLFVYYTDNSGDAVISEFKSDKKNNQVDMNSEKKLLTIDEPYSNHNGGQLKFGKDGFLYIGTGDGGSAGDPQENAQDLNELLGKLLRIDVDSGDKYSIPEDNPFVDRNDARGEIWAYGLRNPWRFSFDHETHDLFIADVGQNEWEEVNYQHSDSKGGENYGWNYLEGFNSFKLKEGIDVSELEMPVVEYNHDHGCSVTGGYVYRGSEFNDIKGTYFFGDYCSGIIWGLRRNSEDEWEYAQFLDSDLAISSFGIDKDNEIYIIDFRKGDIYRLVGE